MGADKPRLHEPEPLLGEPEEDRHLPRVPLALARGGIELPSAPVLPAPEVFLPPRVVGTRPTAHIRNACDRPGRSSGSRPRASPPRSPDWQSRGRPSPG